MVGHFWSDAPTVSWWTYLYRKFIDTTPVQPTLLPESQTLSKTKYPIAPGYSVFPLSTRKVREYSLFLKQHFYGPQTKAQLYIPHQVLERHLEDQSWSGVELTTSSGALVGLVIQKRCVQTAPFPVACVEWICVHSAYRSRGLADILLRGLYVFSAQNHSTYAHTFRKEGYALSIPPVKTETILLRKRQHRLRRTMTFTIQELPTGVLIFETDSLKLWIQPTYEILENSQHTFEILSWEAKTVVSRERLPYLFEELIDALPAHIHAIYASSEFPHLDSLGWVYQGQQSWYAFHYDPGSPVRLICY